MILRVGLSDASSTCPSSTQNNYKTTDSTSTPRGTSFVIDWRYCRTLFPCTTSTLPTHASRSNAPAACNGVVHILRARISSLEIIKDTLPRQECTTSRPERG
ncbi:unnamed protein product, partial [Ectocarpus fasciculatus]